MGIFDFFRKKPEIRAEEVKIDRIEDFLSEKRKEAKIRETNLYDIVKELLSNLIKDLSTKNNVLKNININEKKQMKGPNS